MALITVSEARTLLEEALDDSLPEVSDSLFLIWVNFINRIAYDILPKLNPENYLQQKTYNVLTGTSAYALPTTAKDEKGIYAGLFETTTGSIYQIQKYDTQTGAFTVGLTITGGTSGATGVISEDNSTFLVLKSTTGSFEDNEIITDTSTGSATTNESTQGYSRTDTHVQITNFGSGSVGYWNDSTNINITPENGVSSKIYIYRYLPKLTKLTLSTGITIFNDSDETEEMLSDMLVLYYEKWASTGATGKVLLADAEFMRSLNQVLSNYIKQPVIYKIG